MKIAFLLLCLVLFSGCYRVASLESDDSDLLASTEGGMGDSMSDSADNEYNSATESTQSGDTSPTDTVTEDTVTEDSETVDTETEDSETEDSETEDTVTEDTVTEDSETVDSETEDTATEDTVTEDTVTEDTETEDTETEDTETEDTETEGTETEGTETEGTETEGTETEGTETEDTGVSPPNAFISTWKTDYPGISDDDQIELPLVENGTYDFTVQWGDGTSSHITRWDDQNKLHTYPTPGTYTVVIEGTIVGWQFNLTWPEIREKWPNGFSNYVKEFPLTGPDDIYYIFNERKIVDISQWGTLALGDTESQFLGCANLDITAVDAPDLSQTTSLYGAFMTCWGLTDVPGIANWDVSTISDASYLFCRAKSFNGAVSNWDTSNFTNMRAIFASASDFNQDLSSWDTSKVLDMSNAFSNYYNSAYTSRFNQDIGRWDTSHVMNMEGMFAYAHNFNQNLSAWDTSSVASMKAMFLGALLFNGDVTRWNTSNVTDFSETFRAASNFNQDIGDWDTSATTKMTDMFALADSFNQNIGGWDTSRVTEMGQMFLAAESFNQNIGGWNVGALENADGMLSQAYSLSTANYDALLVGWAAQTVQRDVVFSAGSTMYSPGIAAASRQRLIDEYNWTITDGGMRNAAQKQKTGSGLTVDTYSQ